MRDQQERSRFVSIYFCTTDQPTWEQQTIPYKEKIRKLPLFWIVRVELCCYSDRFFKIHQLTWETRRQIMFATHYVQLNIKSYYPTLIILFWCPRKKGYWS